MSTAFRSIDHIPSFDAVMATGSLSAAARLLGLAQPTVRRHIEQLETELGVRLFSRAANGLTPTELARTLAPMARAVLEEAAALTRTAKGDKDTLRGVIRLTASRVVATHILPLVLADIRATAPDLRFELAATDAPENLARRAADIAIRFTPPKQQSLVAQRLDDVALGFFTGPGMTAPQTVADLATVPFVADDREDLILRRMASTGLPTPQNVVLRCDDPMAQIAHIQAGLGVGICQVKLAARLGLIRVLPHLGDAMPAWLVVHEDQARLPRIRHVFDALKVALPRYM